MIPYLWTRNEIAETIDHAALKPELTEEELTRACRMGRAFGIASVCVRPCDVARARKILEGGDTCVSTVIGFPHGANRTQTKVLEAKLAIADGADELDMVLNIGRLLSGDESAVAEDIEAVAAVTQKEGAFLKVILEICFLSPAQIERATEIARDAGANFVKTSTGFGPGAATPEAVRIMLNAAQKTIGVKASGGIRDYQTAVQYLNLGCRRLGTSATEAILNAAPAE